MHDTGRSQIRQALTLHFMLLHFMRCCRHLINVTLGLCFMASACHVMDLLKVLTASIKCKHNHPHCAAERFYQSGSEGHAA